ETWDRAYQREYDDYEANAVAHSECLFTKDERRPTILCLHPWMSGSFFLQRRLFRRLHRHGFQVVLFALPFHGPRTPTQARFGGPLFPGRCPRRTNEGFGQLIWDLRALLGALEQRVRGPIGAAGMSLGGYAAALLAGVEPRLAFS